MKISDKQIKQRAKELILSHATDVERLTIWECMDYHPWEEAQELTEDEKADYVESVSKAIYRRARVEVYFD